LVISPETVHSPGPDEVAWLKLIVGAAGLSIPPGFPQMAIAER
jgi:hypothetical protein